MRLDEGSLIKIRNAAQQQVLNGQKVVRGGEPPSTATRLAPAGLRHGGTVLGGSYADPLGAVGGRAIGENLGDLLSPKGMSRDALVQRSFELTQPNSGVSRVAFSYPHCRLPEDCRSRRVSKRSNALFHVGRR
jgi:hypothetical protein